MARGTRSQPSQSQPAPTQTQRRRRRQDNDDDDDDDEDGGYGNMDVDGEGNDEDIKRKANDLVRLALFSEQRRVPLKREEINKKVMGSGTKAFNAVLAAAQRTLRDTFGMDLVELHRDAEDQEPEATQSTGPKKRTTASGTKSYILRSILHPTIIDMAARSDEVILAEESEAIPETEDDDESWPRAYGSIISWSNSDQLNSVGILHVILSLILVSGRVMSEADLRAQLKRLNLDHGSNIPVGVQATHQTVTIDNFLSQAQRSNYLEQSRVGADGTSKRGGKRARGGDDDNVQYEWRWGPRAHSEIGEQGIGRFLAEFMAERSAAEQGEDDSDDDGAERQRALRKMTEKRFQGIETAAGGTLHDVR